MPIYLWMYIDRKNVMYFQIPQGMERGREMWDGSWRVADRPVVHCNT